jgi:hypothetical protein
LGVKKFPDPTTTPRVGDNLGGISTEEPGPALPAQIVRAVPLLLGAKYGCPVPLEAHCTSIDRGRVQHLARSGRLLTAVIANRKVAFPRNFFSGVIGSPVSDSEAVERQNAFAAESVRTAMRDLLLWREEIAMMAMAISCDLPLSIPYFAAYAHRTTFFMRFFRAGLTKRFCGAQAAVLPSEFAAFLTSQVSIQNGARGSCGEKVGVYSTVKGA